MAESAALALQVAMRARLLAHAPLTALLGGPNVHDHAPQGGALPYVVFAEIETRDEGTQNWPLAEHAVTLHAWSKAEGVKQAQALLAEIDAALTGISLTLTGHRLIDLRGTLTIGARVDGVRRRGLIRFRAVTEPL